MLAPADQVNESLFRRGIAKYVAKKCLRYHVSQDDVNDIAQEAFCHIVAKRSEFRPEQSDFEQWARGIAWNVVREYLRRARLYRALFIKYDSDAHDFVIPQRSPEQYARRNQLCRAIENAAQTISLRQAEVFALRAIDDVSHKEIARELCMSEAMSEKEFQRARDHLALCFSDKAFSVMPPSLAGCDEPKSLNGNESRWPERSHYAAQIIGAIMALLPFVPACSELPAHASVTEKVHVLAPAKNHLMYRPGKLVHVQDEPAVLRDAPSVKPEPAPLPRVRDVSKPIPARGKPYRGWKPSTVINYSPPSDVERHGG